MSDAAPPPPAPAASRTNSKALASLVLGVLGVVFVPCGGLFPYSGTGAIVVGGLALLLGILGRRELVASGGAERGDGMATAGIVLGGIAVLLGIVLVILTAAVLATGDIDSLVP